MIWPAGAVRPTTVGREGPAGPVATHPALAGATRWARMTRSRDVLARVIYGFRISVLFGFTLTIISSVVGIAAGAVQGFYGGLTDLLFQRFIEIWSGMPQLVPADHPGLDPDAGLLDVLLVLPADLLLDGD